MTEASLFPEVVEEEARPPLTPENQKWLDELPLSVFLDLYE